MSYDSIPEFSVTYDVLLIDGSHLLHRATHSQGDLGIWRDGEFIMTGGIYGFIKSCLTVWKRYAGPDSQLIVCWEGGNSYRRNLDPEYKANRKVASDDTKGQAKLNTIRSQRSGVQRVIASAGWRQAFAPGYEADDALAALAFRYQEEGKTVAIYSGDQDMHQCVTNRTHVISSHKGKDTIWTPAKVEEKWGVPPNRVPESKALIGDSGDNIPGIEGLGINTAAKILDGTPLNQVHRRAELGLKGTYKGKKWSSPSLGRKILANWDQILKARVLATVVRNCAIVEAERQQGDPDSVMAALEALEFRSLTREGDFQLLMRIGE